MGTEINLDLLTKQPWIARQQAYLACSGFSPEADLVAEPGSGFMSCSVASASVGLTVCAERAAAADAEAPIPPCGVCRQVLAGLQPSMRIRGAGRNVTYRDSVPNP